MRKVTYSQLYNELSDIGVERKEIFRLVRLAKERALIHEEVAIWRPEALESDYEGLLYKFVFQCEIIDGKEYWFIKE